MGDYFSSGFYRSLQALQTRALALLLAMQQQSGNAAAANGGAAAGGYGRATPSPMPSPATLKPANSGGISPDADMDRARSSSFSLDRFYSARSGKLTGFPLSPNGKHE